MLETEELLKLLGVKLKIVLKKNLIFIEVSYD